MLLRCRYRTHFPSYQRHPQRAKDRCGRKTRASPNQSCHHHQCIFTLIICIIGTCTRTVLLSSVQQSSCPIADTSECIHNHQGSLKHSTTQHKVACFSPKSSCAHPNSPRYENPYENWRCIVMSLCFFAFTNQPCEAKYG